MKKKIAAIVKATEQSETPLTPEVAEQLFVKAKGGDTDSQAKLADILKDTWPNIVKAAGTSDGAKSGAATKKTNTATAASQAAHEASAAAHGADGDESDAAHKKAKDAHEAASDAHKSAMLSHAKAGNADEASEHAKAMAAHDTMACLHEGNCEPDEDDVKACQAGYAKFVKACDGEECVMPDMPSKAAMSKETDGSQNATRKAILKSKIASETEAAYPDGESHGSKQNAHENAAYAHIEAASKADPKGDVKDFHDEAASYHMAQANEHRKVTASGEAPKGIVHCRAASFEFDPELPPQSDFMFMPGGTHTIVADYDGKPHQITVKVDAKSAERVKQSFDRYVKASPNRPPYGCFEHRENEASFWPKDFVWQTGADEGIYCKAEWTEPGIKNVRGKVHRSFSPSTAMNADWAKAVDRGDGVFVFPDGVRGSQSNPCEVTGVSPKSVGSLTNWPAFKSILPVRAKEVAPQPPTTKPAEQPKTTMKIKFVRASSSGGHAAGTTVELPDAEAQPFVTANEAFEPHIADIVLAQQDEIARLNAGTSEQSGVLIDQAIVRAKGRGAIPPADEVKAKAAKDQALKYLKGNVPIADIVEIIDQMPVLVKANGLETRRTPAGDGVTVELGNETVGEACEGIVKAYEPMTGPVNGSMGLVRAGKIEDAIEKSKWIAAKYKAVIQPVLAAGKDFMLRDLVRGADYTDPNGQVGTLSTGLLLMRDLGYLKAKLVPIGMASVDMSAEPVKFNQPLITRYKTPPNVLTWVKGVGYTANANDTTRTVSTPSTTDVSVTMDQNKAVCIKFDNQLLGSTMRNLFAEQQEMQFYSLAKTINQHFISQILAATWAPKTEAGAALTAPKFNLNGWNIPSLIAIKNKLTMAQIPDEGRHVLLHSVFHDVLLQDTNLLTAAVIKAALQQQTNADLTNFGNTELPEIFGLDIHESQLFQDQPYVEAGWNVTKFGFAGNQAAMIFVTRVPNDYTQVLPGIPATAAIQIVTEPDSGLSMMFSKWVDHNAKETNAECALMYKASQGHPGMGMVIGTVGGAQN